MKLGTDAMVLGTVAAPPSPKASIIDVGTGTGIVSLLLAQRFPQVAIKALEIDVSAFHQAKHNVTVSPFSHQIDVVASDWLRYSSTVKVDWVISNPPFHTEDIATAGKRSLARQASALPYNSLLDKAVWELGGKGQLTLIGPPAYIKDCSAHLLPLGYTLFELIKVSPKEGQPAHRWVASWHTAGQPLTVTHLAIRAENGQYTAAYQTLTAPFYLNQ